MTSTDAPAEGWCYQAGRGCYLFDTGDPEDETCPRTMPFPFGSVRCHLLESDAAQHLDAAGPVTSLEAAP